MSKVIQLHPRRFGASQEQWDRLTQGPYLAHLLPIVCDPTAPISPDSTLKEVGKVPCMFNTRGEVAGLKKWQNRQTTMAEATKWAKNSAIGIGLQCRAVFAIDADITNQGLASRIHERIRALLDLFGVELPMRYRSNSPKFLLAFEVHAAPDVRYTKRIIQTEHGNIEFLANGQQFVAAGTHKSGVHYQWDTPDGLTPFTFPILDGELYDGVFKTLQKEFGVEPEIVTPEGKPCTQPRAPHATPDPLADHIEASGFVRSYTNDGRYNILCPFRDEHSGDSGDTETQYFPANTGGFVRGHFKCLHAHCAHRTDQDYVDAIGFEYPADFDDETPPPTVKKTHDFVSTGRNPETLAECMPFVEPSEVPIIREKDGSIKATATNTIAVFSSPKWCLHGFVFDYFIENVMTAQVGTNDWRPLKDTDYQVFKSIAEKANVSRPPYDEVRRSIHVAASKNTIDSAQLWVKALKWDGVPRVANFLHKYMGAPDTPYIRACSLYLWSSLVGRQLEPGVKADMVVILVSPQGAIKTESVRAMVPDNPGGKSYAVEVDLSDDETDIIRSMRGKMIVEISELRGLRTREAGHIKAFISRRYETTIAKYCEHAVESPRRSIFIGTTNEDEFLSDPTGERRWLPVEIVRSDVEAIKRDRSQLWAEGREYFEMFGVMYAEAETLAREEHARYSVTHEWAEPILEWLKSPSPNDGSHLDEALRPKNYERDLSDLEIVMGALGMPSNAKGYSNQIRQIMSRLGFVKRRVATRQGLGRGRRWVLHGVKFPNELEG